MPELTAPSAEERRAEMAAGLDEEIRRLVERSTSAQGLPFHVRDQAVLARVAALVQAIIGKNAVRHAS